MMIHDITAKAGRYPARKRVGRGRSSGLGKTSGRGHKGAGSRSGHAKKLAFEGGQMPYFRRLPKRGFGNSNFRTDFWLVNLGALVSHPDFQNGGEVTRERLIASGLVRDDSRPVKILGDLHIAGEDAKVEAAYQIMVERVSDSARRLVTDAGGTVTELGTRRDRARGVDRNSEDRTPTNLTKKLTRRREAEKREKEPISGGGAEQGAKSKKGKKNKKK